MAVTMRQRLIALRIAAMAHVQAIAAREPNYGRVEERRELADDLAYTHPHFLSHGCPTDSMMPESRPRQLRRSSATAARVPPYAMQSQRPRYSAGLSSPTQSLCRIPA
jgi:hypothetical protein